MQERGLDNIWLKDSVCSCHMIGSKKWFSSLDPVIGNEYITFGDKLRGQVVSCGSIRVNEFCPQGCCFGFKFAFQSAFCFAIS
jgi:hypothetical protein